MDAEQLKQMKKLQREVDDANELAERFIQGYTNFDAEYVGNKLTKAKAALTDYLDSITEKKIDDAYQSPGESFKLKAKAALTDYLDSITEKKIDDAYQSPGESFKLKASVQTYELSIADLAQLIAGQLGVPVARLTISPRREFSHGDAIGEGEYIFAGLTVTVKNT